MFRHIQVKLTSRSLHNYSRSDALTLMNVSVQELAIRSTAQETWLDLVVGLLLCDRG